MYELWCNLNYSDNWLAFQWCLLLNGLADIAVALALFGLLCILVWLWAKSTHNT